MFLKNSQYSWKNTFVGESFWQSCSLKSYNFNKKRLLQRCFPVNIKKFLKTALFIEYFWWLLLYHFKKVTGLKTSNVIKKKLQHCEIWESLKNTFFYRTPLLAASEQIQEISVVHWVTKWCSGHLAQIYLSYPISC